MEKIRFRFGRFGTYALGSFILVLSFNLNVLAKNKVTHGVRIKMGQVIHSEDSKRVDTLLKVDDGHVLVEVSSGVSLIFQKKSNQFYLVNPSKKIYQEVDLEGLKKTQAALKSMKEMLRDQIKKMPKEQRVALEPKLFQLEALEAEKPIKIFKLEKKGVPCVRWKCDVYLAKTNGVKQEEVWTASWEALGLNQSDFLVIRHLKKSFDALGKSLPSIFTLNQKEAEKKQGYPGIAVKINTFINGTKASEWEIKEVYRGGLAQEEFEIPQGYQKKVMPRIPVSSLPGSN